MRFGIFLLLAALSKALLASSLDLLLLNEHGKVAPVKLPNGLAPLGMMVWVSDDHRPASYCQAVHAKVSTGKRYILTARHCFERVNPDDSLAVFYYDNRTDSLRSITISEPTPVHLKFPIDAKNNLYHLDLSVLPLKGDTFSDWDSMEIFKAMETSLRGVGNFRYGGYRFTDIGELRAKFTWIDCKGEHGVSPRIQVTWKDDENLFTHDYFFSYSKQNVEWDEKMGLFLWRCDVFDGGSGGVVLNQKNELAGLLVSVINSETVKKTWEEGLSVRFANQLRKEKGRELGDSSLLFSAVSGDKFKEDFSLDVKEALYGVAVSRKGWETELPKLLPLLTSPDENR